MLPDFIALKRSVQAKLTAAMQRRVAEEGVLSMVTHERIHEGDGFVLHRSNGEIVPSTFQEHAAEFELSKADLQSRGFDAVAQAVESTVDQFAEAGHKMMFDALSEATADRAIHAGGRPFTAELYLDGLETMDFSFTVDGEWSRPTLVMHPAMLSKAKEQLERLEQEPALKARLAALVDRKKADWRAREANRELAD